MWSHLLKTVNHHSFPISDPVKDPEPHLSRLIQVSIPWPSSDYPALKTEDSVFKVQVSKSCWYRSSPALVPQTKLRQVRQSYECEARQEAQSYLQLRLLLLYINCHQPWHGWASCDRSKDKGMRSFQRKSFVKQCPKCRTTIEKSEGCNHMTCHVCGHDFWWLCGEEYKNGSHFSLLNGCSANGSGNKDFLVVALLMPCILLMTPCMLGLIWSKSCFNKIPTMWWILWIPLTFLAIAAGVLLIWITPVFYLILAAAFLRGVLKKSRFK